MGHIHSPIVVGIFDTRGKAGFFSIRCEILVTDPRWGHTLTIQIQQGILPRTY
jgi:hypothetical protein